MKKHAIIPIFISHRGCPNQCVFCNQKRITTKEGDVTLQSARDTIETYLSSLEGSGIETEISFFGGSFTAIPMEEQSAFLKLAKEYKDAGRVSKIHCSTRPDCISEEILENLKSHGMDVIELGVQSFDEEVLCRSKRGHDAASVEKACALIHAYGFTLGIQLMIGLPGDSHEACMYSVFKTIQMKPAIARIYPTVVLPQTELFDLHARGEYEKLEEEKAVETAAQMVRQLEAAGIQVIRIGLKSNELIKGDSFHPAFGQMVRGKLALEMMLEELREAPSDIRLLEIIASDEQINFAVGHRGQNRKILQKRFPRAKIHFRKDGPEKTLKVRYEV